MTDGVDAELARDLKKRLQLVNGHADIWKLFTDGPFFVRLIDGLVEPFRPERPTKIAGIESRGFVLGSATALRLGVGFVAVRKAAGLLPGPKLTRRTAPDYRGNEHTLRVQRSALEAHDRVLLVDDWLETGSQVRVARDLIEEGGAGFLGTTAIVDELPDEARSRLGRLHALVHAEELLGDG